MSLETPHLARVAAMSAERRTAPSPAPATVSRESDRCDLCAEALPDDHRHLLDLKERRLLCACGACRLLFDRAEAGAGRYRLVPERRLRLDDFALDDELWERLEVPVGIAFFLRSTSAGRVVALYPGPMGVAESLLGLEAWSELERANPVLDELELDVEALLVHRARGARDHFLVPIDDCYRLAGLIRARWSGLAGGEGLRAEVARFLDELSVRSERAPRRRRHARQPQNRETGRETRRPLAREGDPRRQRQGEL